MENINIIDGKDDVFKTPDDIIKFLTKDEQLVGVIPFVSGNYIFLEEKKYNKKAILSQNRINAGYFIMVLAIIAGVISFYISKNYQNYIILLVTIIVCLAIIGTYFYVINRFYKNINLIAISDKRIYFVSLKENVPFSHHKKGYRIAFYAPFDIIQNYKHYCTRCGNLVQVRIDGKRLILATVNFEEYKYHKHFKSTLLSIEELSST
jgi:hypothetical protein